MITICTPTYNRVHTLPKLYQSLLNQSEKNFEWLVVDDGSTDETQNFLHTCKDEHKIKVRSFSQENSGKHIAVNKGMKEAKGEFFIVVDSDDYLLPETVSYLIKTAKEIESQKEVSGFTGIHFAEQVQYNPSEYGKTKFLVNGEIQYTWVDQGELVFCYKTDVARKFPFPQFAGEKFCPESLIHRRIARKYSLFFTDAVLVRGEYLEDGLSKKYGKLLENNPKAAMLSYAEKIKDTSNKEEKEKLATYYWNIALKTKRLSVKELFFVIPPFLTIATLFKKWKN